MAMHEITARYALCGYMRVEMKITNVWYGVKYVCGIYVAFSFA
jgi:hypothetical protein